MATILEGKCKAKENNQTDCRVGDSVQKELAAQQILQSLIKSEVAVLILFRCKIHYKAHVFKHSSRCASIYVHRDSGAGGAGGHVTPPPNIFRIIKI